MNRDPSESLTPEQARAREAFRAWTAPDADPEFRARLRRQFVHGDFGPGRTTVERFEGRGWFAAPSLRWAAVAAAVSVLAVAGYALNRGPSWAMFGASGMGVAVIDGLPVPMNHHEDLRRRLKPGVRLRIPAGSQLMLAVPGQMAFQVTPGTDVTLPAPPGRWFGREIRGEVRGGVLRIVTGERFHGARLTLTTPEARVRVTGSTLAVICEPEGTCVCVLEGVVEVGRQEGAMATVARGERRFVYNDSRDPEIAPMRELESFELTALRQRNRSILGR